VSAWGVERWWFVSIDTARLRQDIRGAALSSVRTALDDAARATHIHVGDSYVARFGIRLIVQARHPVHIRTFVRRFIGLSARPSAASIRWRPGFRFAAVQPGHRADTGAYLSMIRESTAIVNTSAKRGKTKRPSAGKAATILRVIEQTVDAQLGADETAARTRRYVAEHDAPADDAAAFARLCAVIFAQGIGYHTVAAKFEDMRRVFSDFDPAKVARFDEAAIAQAIASPLVIRNAEKVRACVENAKRWIKASADGNTYLGRVAGIAAHDDPAAGWPLLADMLSADFLRVGAAAARQALKRWGFFTAFAHPGARRVLERIGLIAPDAPAHAVQILIGKAGETLARDPYAVEAVLALFAGIGPCRKEPQCERCGASERCLKIGVAVAG
jgi:DNA-3-methyladenine glycosylase I